MKNNTYLSGLRRGFPVGIGYLSVSFGFGAMSAANGVRAIDAALISLTSFAGAGQVAGLTLMIAQVTLWEVILTLIVINSRYALMSLALSQKLGEKIGFFQRLVIAVFNTDELFALLMAERMQLSTSYIVGLGTCPLLGWTAGTLVGALAGSVLPPLLRSAAGIMLYGMFVAIIMPPARKERPVLITVILALVLSCMLHWMPVLSEISSGISIVICAVVAAGVCAFAFPISDEEAV